MTPARSAAAEIRVQRVSVRHGERERAIDAVRDADLVVAPGEFVCLLGPSGCGKSTLLGTMGGFVRASSGCVRVDGRVVEKPSAELGMVQQQHSLFPWLSVIDNVAFGLKMRGVGAKERRSEASAMLRLVGLSGFEKTYPAQLSGGMQHRAELARVLVNRPRVLLMDEPFGALDSQSRATMQELVLDIWSRFGTTIVFVTHDIDEAVLLSDRVVAMTDRPGTIAWERTIDIARPRRFDVTTSHAFVQAKRECVERVRAGSTPPVPPLESLEPSQVARFLRSGAPSSRGTRA